MLKGACAALLALWASAAMAAAPAQPAGPAVLIDPGHGAPDLGVQADGFDEAGFVLALGQDLAKALKASGIEAQLTRDSAEGLSLGARVRLANQLRPKAMLSLHVNASFQQAAQGPRLFVPEEGAVDEPASPLWEQAARLRARDSRSLGLALARSLGATGPRPVQTLKMGLFRGLAVPVCVVELGFATDAEALAGFKDPARRQALAQRLASGLRSYLQEAGHGQP